MKNIKTTHSKYTLLVALFITSFLFVQCIDEDSNNAIEQETCDDGIKNGEETEIDCGGPVCPPCEESGIDFSGTFVQKDILGRPGVNMFFGGTDAMKNEFNVSKVSDRTDFQESFQGVLEDYHNIYANAFEIPEEELNYETNILGWNASTFSRIMSQYDALQVAPNGATTYYNVNSSLVFTGRNLSDDAMDVTLMLLFGGTNGTRFDGNNDTPQLTTDAVEIGDRDDTLSFPYLEVPLNE